MSILSQIQAAMPARISDLPLRWAEQSPDRVALETDTRTVTWAEMAAAIDRMATLLKDQGIRPGDRVMVINENGIAAAILVFAISRLDAWASMLNARMSAREITTMRDFAGARRVIYTTGDSPAAAAHATAVGASSHHDPILGDIAIGPLDETCTPEPVFAEGNRQIATLTFTSGTTGHPKAVMLAHHAVMFTGASQCYSRKITQADRLYVVAPLSHSIGLSSNLLAAAWSGATAILPSRFDPAHLAKALQDDKVTFLVAVPQVYGRLLDYADEHGLSLSNKALRVTGCGGAPLDATLKKRVTGTFGLPFGNGYGATEMVPITRVPDGVEAEDNIIGEAQPGVEIRIVATDGTDVPEGQVGELWARGPSLMAGYYHDDIATADVMRDGGWLATGDLAQRDPDGNYRIVGRIKEVIIRSGFNVYPTEVEGVLNTHPAIAASAVVGRTVEGNEEVVAYVQLLPGRDAQISELHGFLRDNLAAYKVPSEIIILQLPIGPTGKILKSALKRDAQAMARGGTLA